MPPYEDRSLRDLAAVAAQIEAHVYQPVAGLQAVAWVTPEPVAFSRREQGTRLDLEPGLTWGRLWDCAWFHLTGSIPESARSRQVVALVDVSGEACVVDAAGSPVLGLTTVSSDFSPDLGTPGKRVVPLVGAAAGGEPVDLWIEAGCNDLFGELQNQGRLAEASIATVEPELRALSYDFSVLLDLVAVLPENSARRARVHAALTDAARLLLTFEPAEAASARQRLQPELNARGGEPSLEISACGQAHLDLAWLWPIRETIRKGGRTFATALALMDRYPEYVFGASQPQLYAWMRERYPRLSDRIRARIAEGRWEPQGAMWVEGDVNLAGGEAIVRQLLYGIRYYREELGYEANVAWLPDNFGFPASLPQILSRAGIHHFLTIKLSWNLINRFPRHSFWWEGIDGTRVLAHMPPEGNYNSPALPHNVRRIEESYADKEVSRHAMLLFGVGDGGGGPGEEHLERLRRLTNLEGVPPVRQEPASRLFERLEAEADGFATWTGELYLERHQGTFTSQARSKRLNRRLELALRELDLTASMAQVMPVSSTYAFPHQQVEAIWKEMLLYQFHDILPGSSITRVYDESLPRYEALLEEVESLTRSATQSLNGGGAQASVFNPLGWQRTEWVRHGHTWSLVTAPSFSVVPLDQESHLGTAPPLKATPDRLENDLLSVALDGSGALLAVRDRQLGREVLTAGGAGNRLAVYADSGHAWDFPVDYDRVAPDRPRLEASTAEVCGPRAVVHQRYRYGESVIEQDVILTAGNRRVDFVTRVDWRESGRMLRTSFPVAIRADRVTCDIQFGSVARPTVRNTSWDIAKREFCAHKWVDLSQPDYGVALLNDCKYGHRVEDGVLDLNLLRSPSWPDATADRARHEFTYSLLPHPGDHRSAGVIRAGYELNVPLRVIAEGPAPIDSLLSVDAENVVVETVKPAEEGQAIVVRLYESWGADASLRLNLGFDIETAARTDLLERPLEPADHRQRQVDLRLAPFEIATLLLVPSRRV